ncbi:MAG: Asp-tRNA(Asn)/Glu-tRNA(Gln) amidotransferase subunit GatA [Lachnospiraceae bacterium]|nr:Asp-tRNA(Asn)/Glu-tRNA(Gln) amidotransferase subunit GatA [Lachnospiraceae bacterium]
MELLQMSVRMLNEKIKNKVLGVKETVSALHARISEAEPGVGAFLSWNEDRIKERIDEVQAGIYSGRYAGPLAGLPIALKDNICTKDLSTTCGSKMLKNFVPTYDATVVKRLLDAGMIIIGKTNLDEFAMGSTTETSAFKVTKNPWNTAYVPGGSSGGSCAAVAAGEVPLALGSDTGGSVRQPAAFCGVVGMKPTYGRVSRYGLVAYASSMDQIGPIGRTVADCRVLYECIAGYDEKDATTVKKDVQKPFFNQAADKRKEHAERLKGKRFAVPKEYLAEGTSEAVREAVNRAVELLTRNGAIVEEISLPMTEYAVATYYIIACAEASSNLSRFDGVKYGYRAEEVKKLQELYVKTRSEGFGEEAKRRILMGSFVLSEGYYDAYYLKALKVRRLIKEEYEKVFEAYDCIVAPTAPGTAPKLGTSLQNPLQMYLGDVDTVAVNLAGLPAISVPCGVDEAALPIGLQFIGNSFCEELLFEVAEAYEELRGIFPTAWEQVSGRGKAGMWSER